MQVYTVNTLRDEGSGSLREAIIFANSNSITKITFCVSGTINLCKNLPKITRPIEIIGNLSKTEIPTITVDGRKKYTLLEICNTNNCVIDALCLINGKKSGILINKSSNNKINNCLIGVDTFNNNASNKYGITIYNSSYNIIGSNPNNLQQYFSNVISFNKNYGIYLVNSKGNQIQNNIIGLSKNCNNKNPNYEGIYLSNSNFNIIGGKKFIDNIKKANNPTGNKGTTTPVFVRPLLGNIISGNKNNGINFIKSPNNEIYGNFVGTDNTGLLNFGNGNNGIEINNSNFNLIGGCNVDTNPFIFYNVVGWNNNNGIVINSSNYCTIQGNFMGIGADNKTPVPNINGLIIFGTSKKTVLGGPIPLGNVISGNIKNGVYLTDDTYGFSTINTFCGLQAFGTAVPNGENGFLIDSNASKIIMNTNVVSGNNKNGISIKGHANNILITENIVGMNTDGNASLPNNANGVEISEKANNITFGGQIPSVITKNIFSSNKGYGILLTDNVKNINMSQTNIGIDILSTKFFSNGRGGLCIGDNVSNCTIGSTINFNYFYDKDNFAVKLSKYTKNNTLTYNFININLLLIPGPHSSNILNYSKNNYVHANNTPYT